MTERLTIDGLCGSEECDAYCYPCDYAGEIFRKLSHYEDFEEQGRLLILPAGFDLERFRMAVASLFCPSVLGADDVGCPAGDSVKRSDCLKCWEKVLKGEM